MAGESATTVSLSQYFHAAYNRFSLNRLMNYSKILIPLAPTFAYYPSISARTKPMHAGLPLLLLVACGFPRPPDVGDDVPGDATDSGFTIHVTTTGDDGNDGLVQPVKTLKRAIELTSANAKVTGIVLATGTYSSASGETFSYIVPSNLTIAGPTGGGAILHGDGAEPALTVHVATLQDLELENFGTAITSMGPTKLSNIRVRTSAIALHGQAGAAISVDDLDITGTAGGCTAGIVLEADADLRGTMLAAHGLGTVLDSSDDSTSDLTGVNINGDAACKVPMFEITSNATFSLHDSVLDTGDGGIDVNSSTAAAQTQVTLTNVTVHNIKTSPASFRNASVKQTGGEFSRNTASTTIGVIFATLSATQVMIDQNSGGAMYAQDMSLKMRDCIVAGNASGIEVSVIDNEVVDIGTAADAGGNLFLNTGTGLKVQGSDFALREVNAIGNTWNPNTQGADADGHYSPILVVQGTSTGIVGANYTLFGSMVDLRL